MAAWVVIGTKEGNRKTVSTYDLTLVIDLNKYQFVRSFFSAPVPKWDYKKYKMEMIYVQLTHTNWCVQINVYVRLGLFTCHRTTMLNTPWFPHVAQNYPELTGNILLLAVLSIFNVINVNCNTSKSLILLLVYYNGIIYLITVTGFTYLKTPVEGSYIYCGHSDK